MNVVVTYIADEAEGNELRHCLRAICRNLAALSPLTVYLVGDAPIWFWPGVSASPIQGVHVPCPRLPASLGQGRPYLDSAHKLAVAAALIGTGDFVWIMDDIFLMRPVDWAWLAAPRALPVHEVLPTTEHKRVKLATFELLRKAGKPTTGTVRDYATHMPAAYDAQRLLALVDAAGWTKAPLSTDTLYRNWYAAVAPATIGRAEQLRIVDAASAERLPGLVERFNPGSINVRAKCWQFIEPLMQRMFPDPCPLEYDQP